MTALSGAVVCCGLTTIDLSYTLGAGLVPGSKSESVATNLDVGGPAANAARTAALLGSRVTLHTILGVGRFADMALAALTADGVTVVDHTPAGSAWHPPISSILVGPGGERTVV
jgi:sugar/nucleoside kinase (ribokinase family)